jgi:hypothetical protein
MLRLWVRSIDVAFVANGAVVMELLCVFLKTVVGRLSCCW